MKGLLSNVRFYVLSFSILLSVVIFLWINSTLPWGLTEMVRLQEIYSATAMAYLYLTLLAGPFCYTFRWFPYRGAYLKARRALGVSAFYFGFLHSSLAFFGLLGGFAGLGYLSTSYAVAVALGFIAFAILLLLTITSTDYMVAKLTFPRWKFLQRFVYLAAVLILIDALLISPLYRDLSSTTAHITFIAIAFLLLLEAPRFDKLLRKFFPVPTFGLSFVVISVALGIIYATVINPVIFASNGSISFDIHAAHRQLAQQQLQQSPQNFLGTNPNLSNIPGLNGDRTKRYSVSMSTIPENPLPNQEVTIRFKVYEASSGDRVTFFRILYEKPMHFISVNSDLTYFHHIHPVQQGQDFAITTQFPKDDLYHLYINFQPFGAIEQQFAFTLPIGQQATPVFSKAQPDTDKSKTFGDYSVSIGTDGTLRSTVMSLGQQKITFTIKDAKTGKPITTLKPYLASFGHLTMINQKTFDFIHVHPYSLVVPPPNSNGGPTVDFLPIGIYGPFKPGIYRAFAQFNPVNKLFMADFTVKIE